MNIIQKLSIFLFISVALNSCGGSNSDSPINNSSTLHNREAPIPSQCYTKTEGHHNPCYTCHQSYNDGRANVQNDGDLQGDYAFSWLGVKNHWINLFKDRSPQYLIFQTQKSLIILLKITTRRLKPCLNLTLNGKVIFLI